MARSSAEVIKVTKRPGALAKPAGAFFLIYFVKPSHSIKKKAVTEPIGSSSSFSIFFSPWVSLLKKIIVGF